MLTASLAAVVTAGRASAATPLAALTDPDRWDGVLGLAVITRDRDGRVSTAAAHGFGLRGTPEAPRLRPFTLDAPVRVASISKLVAVAGFASLVQAGRIGWDNDVSAALGWRLRHPAFPDQPITARRLASHTAGLRNGRAFPVRLGQRLQDALTPGGPLFDDGAWFSPPTEPPGTFGYSDANVAMLAQLIERLSGERFDRFMTRALFAPLGLDAGYNWSGVSQAKRDAAAACARRLDGAWAPQVDGEAPPAPIVRVLPPDDRPELTAEDYRPGDNGFAFSPQGGLRASVRDLDRLAVAFSTGGVPGLTRTTLADMQTPIWRWTPAAANGANERGLILAYGLGVHAPTGAESDAFFGLGSAAWRGHFGEAYGLVSGLWWNTNDRRTLAYVIAGTPGAEDAPRPRGRTALTPWEESIIAAAIPR